MGKLSTMKHTLCHPVRSRRSQIRASLFVLFCVSAGLCGTGIEWKPSKIRTAIDLGHVVKGMQSGQKITMLPLNRNTITFESRATLRDLWIIDAGFKSILWWPFGGEGNMPHERVVRVEPSLSNLALVRTFGENRFFRIGYFPYKYNKDAINLGEYLHRSGTYPGYLLSTENYELMCASHTFGKYPFRSGAVPSQNNALMYGAYTYLYGVHFRFSNLGGLIQHDATLSMATETRPVGDLTPGYELSLNTPLFEFGMGVVYNHGISFHPSELKPKNRSNQYIDTTVQINGEIILDTNYWSHRGVKAMARMALNVRHFINSDMLSPHDLRLFLELAVLGIENRPRYYNKLSERMPFMLGIHLPTFNLIDLLCVQLERYATPYNSFAPFDELSLPVWRDVQTPVTRDDWKWSVRAQKKISALFSLHLQVANDHLRTLRYDKKKSDIALTRSPSDWYYLLKFEFGI